MRACVCVRVLSCVRVYACVINIIIARTDSKTRLLLKIFILEHLSSVNQSISLSLSVSPNPELLNVSLSLCLSVSLPLSPSLSLTQSYRKFSVCV